jgi:hypothetical protein
VPGECARKILINPVGLTLTDRLDNRRSVRRDRNEHDRSPQGIPGGPGRIAQ